MFKIFQRTKVKRCASKEKIGNDIIDVIEKNAENMYNILIIEKVADKKILKAIRDKYIKYFSLHTRQEMTAKEIIANKMRVNEMLEAIRFESEKGKILFHSDDMHISKERIIITRDSWFVITDNNKTIYIMFCDL